jgi:hypothetical protein
MERVLVSHEFRDGEAIVAFEHADLLPGILDAGFLIVGKGIGSEQSKLNANLSLLLIHEHNQQDRVKTKYRLHDFAVDI